MVSTTVASILAYLKSNDNAANLKVVNAAVEHAVGQIRTLDIKVDGRLTQLLASKDVAAVAQVELARSEGKEAGVKAEQVRTGVEPPQRSNAGDTTKPQYPIIHNLDEDKN
jgi:hypothetical protein